MSIPIEKIKYGTRIVVTDIGFEDFWYTKRENLLGQLGTITKFEGLNRGSPRVNQNGWFSCTITFKDTPISPLPAYFKKVKFRLATDEEIALAEQKKTEPETPDLSCTELEFLVVLESARKWYMLRERPDWTNGDYFRRFPKDLKLYTLSDSVASDCSCCSLWIKECGDGKTNCPLDRAGLWCDSSNYVSIKKYGSGNDSPWKVWVCNLNSKSVRRNAADKIFQAMIDWLAGHKKRETSKYNFLRENEGGSHGGL